MLAIAHTTDKLDLHSTVRGPCNSYASHGCVHDVTEQVVVC
jgi:hypothetical protein